jgi:outer membrane protein, heavy metal efflux system
VKRFAIILAVLLGAREAAAVEPSPPPLDPGALLREAMQNSPAIKAAQARLEASRHAAPQAEASPDPEVSVAYINDGLTSFTLGESEFSQLSLNWRQEIRPSRKRRQAREVATRGAEVAEKESERTRLQVRFAVKSAYAELLRLDQTAAVLEELRAVLVALEETTRRRYEVGQGIQESVLKAQTAILSLEAESTRVAQDRLVAEARLNAAVGRSPGTPVGPAQIPLTGDLPQEAELQSAPGFAASPELEILEAEVGRSQAAAELARVEQKPDYLWSAAYQYRGDLDPMVMGMFGWRLPFHRAQKQAQALAQAESDLTAAQQELAEGRIRTQSEARQMVASAQRARRLLSLYDDGILPQAANTLESARASYSVGRIGLQDLLSDLKVLLEARKDRAALEAEWIQAVAALERVLGVELLRAPANGPAAGGGDAS